MAGEKNQQDYWQKARSHAVTEVLESSIRENETEPSKNIHLITEHFSILA